MSVPRRDSSPAQSIPLVAEGYFSLFQSGGLIGSEKTVEFAETAIGPPAWLCLDPHKPHRRRAGQAAFYSCAAVGLNRVCPEESFFDRTEQQPITSAVPENYLTS